MLVCVSFVSRGPNARSNGRSKHAQNSKVCEKLKVPLTPAFSPPPGLAWRGNIGHKVKQANRGPPTKTKWCQFPDESIKRIRTAAARAVSRFNFVKDVFLEAHTTTASYALVVVTCTPCRTETPRAPPPPRQRRRTIPNHRRRTHLPRRLPAAIQLPWANSSRRSPPPPGSSTGAAAAAAAAHTLRYPLEGGSRGRRGLGRG